MVIWMVGTREWVSYIHTHTHTHTLQTRLVALCLSSRATKNQTQKAWKTTLIRRNSRTIKYFQHTFLMARNFDHINVHSSSHIVLIHEILDLMTFVSNYNDYIWQEWFTFHLLNLNITGSILQFPGILNILSLELLFDIDIQMIITMTFGRRLFPVFVCCVRCLRSASCVLLGAKC